MVPRERLSRLAGFGCGALTLDDSPALFELNHNPEIVRYTGEPLMSSLADAEELIRERLLPDYARHGFGRWAIILKESGGLIGFAGLKRLSELDEVDLGYKVRPELWGRGLATEAARASIDYGFRVLKLPRIIGLVDAPNAASIRVLEKSGMVFEKQIEYRCQPVLQYAIARDQP